MLCTIISTNKYGASFALSSFDYDKKEVKYKTVYKIFIFRIIMSNFGRFWCTLRTVPKNSEVGHNDTEYKYSINSM